MHPNGRTRLAIVPRPGGGFVWIIEQLPAGEEGVDWNVRVWLRTHSPKHSPIFDSAQTAEREARAVFDWLTVAEIEE